MQVGYGVDILVKYPVNDDDDDVEVGAICFLLDSICKTVFNAKFDLGALNI